jgi:glutamate-5-semialdehyde dehydrogenase
MNTILSIEKKCRFKSNGCASRTRKSHLKTINQQDLNNYSGDDLAMEKRLLVDDAKIDGMILSLQQLASQDPLVKFVLISRMTMDSK